MNITDILSYNQLDFRDVVKFTINFLPVRYKLDATNSTNCTTLESIDPGFNPYEIETYEDLSKVIVKKVGGLLQQCYEEGSIMHGTSWPIAVDSLLFLNKAAKDMLFPWIATPKGQQFFLTNPYVQQYMSLSEQTYGNGNGTFLTAVSEACVNSTVIPTPVPTAHLNSTAQPTPGPIAQTTLAPSSGPIAQTTLAPSSGPIAQTTLAPSLGPTAQTTLAPSLGSTAQPTLAPTYQSLRGGSSEGRYGNGFAVEVGTAVGGFALVAMVIGILMKKLNRATPPQLRNGREGRIEMLESPLITTKATTNEDFVALVLPASTVAVDVKEGKPKQPKASELDSKPIMDDSYASAETAVGSPSATPVKGPRSTGRYEE